MFKFKYLGDKPYFLRALILFCLFAGAAGICGILLGNEVNPLVPLLLFVGLGIWKLSDMADEKKAQEQGAVAPKRDEGQNAREKAAPANRTLIMNPDGTLDDATASQLAKDLGAAEVKVEAAADHTESKVSTPNVAGAPDFCPNLLTGQLVARFKKTHDENLKGEYLRRLQSIGFSEQEANMLFVFELMILKHDAIELLADDGYLQGNYFDLQHKLLGQEDSWYIEHQRFLCSEIVKIWDEAEWHYWNSHERESMPEDVWEEIHRISRYGGGRLFIDYLNMVAERSSVDLAKVQAYSAAEQQLIFAYKWNVGKNERHPYPLK